jgi:hypothetical protein
LAWKGIVVAVAIDASSMAAAERRAAATATGARSCSDIEEVDRVAEAAGSGFLLVAFALPAAAVDDVVFGSVCCANLSKKAKKTPCSG